MGHAFAQPAQAGLNALNPLAQAGFNLLDTSLKMLAALVLAGLKALRPPKSLLNWRLLARIREAVARPTPMIAHGSGVMRGLYQPARRRFMFCDKGTQASPGFGIGGGGGGGVRQKKRRWVGLWGE